MDSRLRDQLAGLLERHNQTAAGDEPAYIAYGTAGFRGEARAIQHLFFRLGLVSGLRCLQVKANLGIMITASHNPVKDNGIKLIDPNGEMLEAEWEQIVEKFCNTNQSNALLAQIDYLIHKCLIELQPASNNPPKVLLAMDTRPSSEQLARQVELALEAWRPFIGINNIGLATTPALHFLVAESNQSSSELLPLSSYYDKLISGLVGFFEAHKGRPTQRYRAADLIVDCANGVGHQTMRYLEQSEPFVRHLPFKLINVGDGVLNESCGADYVKSSQFPPLGADETGKRYAALDGDADRLVYFYLECCEKLGGMKLRLLDGDKIMALYAKFLKDVLPEQLKQELSMGVVQTAYANGSSTNHFEKDLGIPVEFADTGVKNLHRQAVKYDIGLYFEANGHGTIWFSPKAKQMLHSTCEKGSLRLLVGMLNNYTGDAISDLLMVESILRYYDWDIRQWDNMYTDVANSLIKVEIPDRRVIKTSNAGRTCTEPTGLQAAIDSMVAEYGSMARCFVRASGTENVVRIYAEAKDQEKANELAQRVGQKVKADLH